MNALKEVSRLIEESEQHSSNPTSTFPGIWHNHFSNLQKKSVVTVPIFSSTYKFLERIIWQQTGL
jgi:hypothetical protein